MRIINGLLMLSLLGLVGACGVTQDDYIGDNSAQQTLKAGEAVGIVLPSGATLNAPAGLLAEGDDDMVVIFADVLAGYDGSAIYYPTEHPVEEDLLAAVVINAPADRLMHAALQLRFAFREGLSAVRDSVYAVYRFDAEHRHWLQWGETVATVEEDGVHANAALPTGGFRGFVGSLAIFAEHTSAAFPAVPTVIQGTVFGDGAATLATDVGVYVYVGAVRYPTALGDVDSAVGNDDPRVPNLPDPTTGEPMDLENTVDSAADGTFLILVPDNLIGQVIALEFGTEDPGRVKQEEFDVLTPGLEENEVTSMVVQYGTNRVRSHEVRASAN